MFNRREMLFAGAGAVALAGPAMAWAQSPAGAPQSFGPNPALTGEDAKLDRLLIGNFNENLDRSPETVTSLGLDSGPRAAARSQLNDRSAAFIEARKAEAPGKLAELKAIDRSKLSEASKVTYDVADFQLTRAVERSKLGFGGFGIYVVSQQGGAYQQLPDWLDNQHPVKSKEDADAYLARLQAFGTALDQETERVRMDAGKGVMPPAFIIDKIITQLTPLRDTPGATSNLSASVERRAAAAGATGYGARAAQIVDQTVRPAAGRQLAVFEGLRAKATNDAGVWKLPNGAEAYAQSLMNFVTVPTPAEEIHKIGLDQVRDLHSRIDVILKAQGMTKGSVAARITALNNDPKHLWPNTDEAKEQLLVSLNTQMADISTRLPRVFNRLPSAPLEIRRVPKTIELGAPGGYYQRASLDGSRPGAYYINLKDTADWPKWGLPTLTYHEGSPGHHFQIAVMQETGELPIYRRTGGFSAYSEGWALYAERIAEELGVYENNPLGQVGYLQSYLFRATRLVVDTGLHHKRWTREQATQWMVDNAAEPFGAAQREIDRYCVNPGQACSYKMGQTVIAGLRDEAEKKLGSKFAIKGFHDAVLLNGAVPLEVLQRNVRGWVSSQA